jgi:hypothetical protein
MATHWTLFSLLTGRPSWQDWMYVIPCLFCLLSSSSVLIFLLFLFYFIFLRHPVCIVWSYFICIMYSYYCRLMCRRSCCCLVLIPWWIPAMAIAVASVSVVRLSHFLIFCTGLTCRHVLSARRADSEWQHLWHLFFARYCTVVYCTVLYCTVLYCTVLSVFIYLFIYLNLFIYRFIYLFIY